MVIIIVIIIIIIIIIALCDFPQAQEKSLILQLRNGHRGKKQLYSRPNRSFLSIQVYPVEV